MIIRATTDRALINRLQREIMPKDPPAAASLGWWWVALVGDKPVGFAGMHPSKRWGDTVYLCRAGVVPEARGQGLQKRLINVRLRKARTMGFKWAITETFNNPPSANSLIACGFRIYNPSRPWAEDSTYWRKRIDAVTPR